MSTAGVLEWADACAALARRLAPPLGSAPVTQARTVVALGVVLCALAVFPLMLAPVPPLVDLPGHLARVDILTRIGRSSFIASHWSADQWLVANLLFDGVTLALAAVLPVVAAAKVYIALALALTMSGCVALHRAHHARWSLWPLASVLLLYDWPLLFGLMGHVGGIGLMLWGAALLELSERRPLWQRWLAAPAGLVCLGAHAIAFLLFAAVLGGT